MRAADGPEAWGEARGRQSARTVLVTVTYNGAEDWRDFYRSVLAQDDPDWELVVIDNASGDGTVEQLRAVTEPRVVRVFNDDNLGVAVANNQGIRHALDTGAARVLLINNDTVLPSDMLRTLRASQEQHRADAVSPLIAFYEDPGRIWYGGGRYQMRGRGGVGNDHLNWKAPLGVVGSTPFETEYAPTTGLLIDRSVFERVGLMDERYFVYWDDADFVWRMRLAELRIVVDPRTVLLHKASVSTGGMQSDFSIRFMFRNQILFTRKFHGRRWTLYTAVLAVVDGVRNVVRGRDRPRHVLLRARAIGEGLRMTAH